ncbi:ribonucleoside-diphosphate reductase subunit alpha [Kineococcus sp. NUM-3379]
MTDLSTEAPDRLSVNGAPGQRRAGSGGTPEDRAQLELTVLRRDGTPVPFDQSRIATALHKAFIAVEGEASGASARVRDLVSTLTAQVVDVIRRRAVADRHIDVEVIQDQVELALMRGGHREIARSYILYREEHARARASRGELPPPPAALERAARTTVKLPDGTRRPLDVARLQRVVVDACTGLEGVDADAVLTETARSLYDGMGLDELDSAPVMAARTLVETEPNYTYVAARLLLDVLQREVFEGLGMSEDGLDRQRVAELYPAYFRRYIEHGVSTGALDPRLAEFDLERLGASIRPERDLDFTFLGLQTLFDRYLLHTDGVRYELPQAFFLRVAMGLALAEEHRDERAQQFYDAMSSFDVMASTPTLFNSGTTRPQMSSCFLTTVPDDLDGIFSAIRDNALLAKYSGGLGNDWTPVRGLGAHIRGTNGTSQGVVPFLKIANDTAVAVNQGGKRKGAVCAYIETWHIDVEQFLDLRKNTGDDRRRTHDMNTANWVPDLFLQRVEADGQWTLFSPDEVADLHDLYGTAFAERYAEYEAAADRGEIRTFRRVRALDLWRRMLTVLFETGHPWITFKDAANVRSPQRHVGVVHSSNLCTEITLNTSRDEVAVCNLASVNLARHVGPDGLDHAKLERTVRTAVRMLDDVIDTNLYTIPQAERSNLKHRPVGLGLMGFSDALFAQRIPYSSDAAVEFADVSMEAISYHAISASVDLAAERGAYESFPGSLWSQGILPIDSAARQSADRGVQFDVDLTQRLDWDALRERVVATGMRNSNVMAIAPTATISNICGVGQSIEPLYRNLFVKANMSGDFTVVNAHLVRDLKARGLWDAVMVADLKHFDGVLAPIDRVPEDLKELYATAFEVDHSWIIAAAARRQKWIDQAQSLNLYVNKPSGRVLDQMYRNAWHSGLKTTYYLRSQSATHVEKSTLRGTDGQLNAVSPVTLPAGAQAPAPQAPATPAPRQAPAPAAPQDAAACSITDPDCEACQ